jgi:hypothetical protein
VPVDSYSKYLTALKEPPLGEFSRQDQTAEVYRFLWLRSFDNPIAVRLAVTRDGGRLIAKMTSGQGGFEPGHLVLNRESSLSKEATEWFLAEVKHARFWDIPTRDDSHAQPDGAEWIIEGVRQGQYHVVDRSSPDRKDPAHVLGIALLINLARFRLLYQDVY